MIQILSPLPQRHLSRPGCCECNRTLIIFVSHRLANVAVFDCAIGVGIPMGIDDPIQLVPSNAVQGRS